MKNINNATMESNILDQLAAFDVRAKINVSIYFEDSDEDKEVAIKTENFIDEDVANTQDTNNLSPHLLEPKKDIKEELTETPEAKSNDKLKEISTLETENLQNKTTNSDEGRKRKQKLLQIYKNKRSKEESPLENVTNYLANQNKESDAQKSFYSNPNCTHQEFHTSQLNSTKVATAAAIPSSNKKNAESVRSEMKSCNLSSLTAVSENMRLVMEAYAYHRQYNTPYDSYKKQKWQFFNDSYNTIVKLIIPETQNKEFIFNFLHKTYEHALKRPGLNKCTVRDYEVLLKELLSWAKRKQHFSQITINTTQTASKQENTVQPTLASANCCQAPVLENSHSKPEVVGTTKSDRICIFSAGSPGNEISSNVDPNLSRHLSTTNNLKNNEASVGQTTTKSNVDNFENNEASVTQTTQKSSVDLPRAQINIQIQPNSKATEANSKNKYLQELLQQPPLIQPCFPNMQSRIYPEMYKYMQTTTCVVKKNLSNNDTIPNQITTIPPQKPIQMQNGPTMIGQSRHIPQQSLPPARILLQNQQSVNTAHKQSTLAPSSYGQMSLPPPPAYAAPPWSQAWQQQVQPELANFQHIQPDYNQSRHIQQLSQLQHDNNILPQYGQYQQIQSQITLRNIQQQNDQVPTRQSQSIMPQHVNPHIQQQSPVLPECEKRLQIGEWHQGLNELYLQGQTQQQSYKNAPRSTKLQNIQPQNGQVPTRQSQSIMPQHVNPYIQQPSPVIPEFEKRLQIGELHQGLNELYLQGHTQQQSHKNAPRSTSTDSGFISPLNFNTSSDQTAPPVPEQTETTQILITHVTSLNPNVPYMAEGNCAICKKTTKKVCMGCMKIYYCTYECQLQDWPKHGPDCNN